MTETAPGVNFFVFYFPFESDARSEFVCYWALVRELRLPEAKKKKGDAVFAFLILGTVCKLASSTLSAQKKYACRRERIEIAPASW